MCGERVISDLLSCVYFFSFLIVLAFCNFAFVPFEFVFLLCNFSICIMNIYVFVKQQVVVLSVWREGYQ